MEEEPKIILVSAVNDYARFDRCVRKNPFIMQRTDLRIVDIDNTRENVAIPKRYNAFIENYDFAKPAWILFCHCDWELMDDLGKWLKGADVEAVYGPIGARKIVVNGRVSWTFCGGVYERRRDGSDFRKIARFGDRSPAETLDCMAFAIHSSLIEKSGFRFDERLSWDCYIEDACIRIGKAGKKVLPMGVVSCHWSGYHITPPSYETALKYMREKYPNEIYAGTVSFIGGKPIRKATRLEYAYGLLRDYVKRTITFP